MRFRLLFVFSNLVTLSAALWAAERKPLGLDQVRKLLAIPVPDTALANNLRDHGVSFDPTPSVLAELRTLCAGSRSVEILERYAAEQCRTRNEKEEQTFSEAGNAGTVDRYRRFLQAFPTGRRRKEVERRLAARIDRNGVEKPSIGDWALNGDGGWQSSSIIVAPELRMSFVWVPHGSFLMGSPTSEEDREHGMTDETQHSVKITEGYQLGKYEVTQRQWRAIMGANPSYGRGADRPVEQVSWEDVQTFLSKLNASQTDWIYRLPTEAEWEHACRAGTTSTFYTGDVLTADQANYHGGYPYGTTTKGKYRRATTLVGSFPPNPWGLYDMAENVREWCYDYYDRYPSGAVIDPLGPNEGAERVARDGCWNYGADLCRSAQRCHLSAEYIEENIGFRLVRMPSSIDLHSSR